MATDYKTEIYVSSSNDPCFNLALEDFLFDKVEQDGNIVILYLWQNKNTVVIGKSQNAWKECRVSLLEEDGGKLVRRTSGGGAVYHDLGNMCYTFIAPMEIYDLGRQLKVILEAVGKLGVKAHFTGRNDIVTDDERKFSGNAFRFTKKTGLMHGTLLLDTDSEKLSKYLQVSPAKIASKGIKSVRSRIVNLITINPDITPEKASQALISSFLSEYAGGADSESAPYTVLSPDNFISDSFSEKLSLFSSWEWRLGQTYDFDITGEKKFSWGLINISFTVENGMAARACVYTDAMDADLGPILSKALTGLRMSLPELEDALLSSIDELKKSSGLIGNPDEIYRDICSLLREML